MEPILQIVITAVCSVLASSGFWAFMTSRRDKHSATRDMLLGLGHDRIMALGTEYLERGNVTNDEYENLHDYLYKPYKELGGNGTAEHIVEQVGKLPMSAKKV